MKSTHLGLLHRQFLDACVGHVTEVSWWDRFVGCSVYVNILYMTGIMFTDIISFKFRKIVKKCCEKRRVLVGMRACVFIFRQAGQAPI